MRGGRERRWGAVLPTLSALLVGIVGCASVPPDRFGVDRIRFHGVDQMDEYALRACLATAERDRFGITLGTTTEPTCNAPPFDGGRARLPLWPWPWTDFTVYDRNVFERDLRRIERWYQARGYYDARIMSTSFDPEAAAETSSVPTADDAAAEDGAGDDAASADRADGDPESADPAAEICERRDDDEGCTVDIEIRIEEGEPVLVRELSITGADALATSVDFESEAEAEEYVADIVEELQESWRLETGARFDETFYNQSRAAMRRVLGERGYACGVIQGDVAIHREERWADVSVHITPGPVSTLGEITVQGNEDLSERVILAAAALDPGMPYDESELLETQHAVYSLGTFASVDVITSARRAGGESADSPELELALAASEEPTRMVGYETPSAEEPAPTGETEEQLDERLAARDRARQEANSCTGIVDVTIRVRPGRELRYGVGAGVQSGIIGSGINTDSVSLWDVHLLAFVEHRNVFGGLQRLRLEDRPRFIFNAAFPEVGEVDGAHNLGNEVRLQFRQPAFPERRTTLLFTANWDFGPDPNEVFRRHNFDAAIGLRRVFFDGRLNLGLGVHGNLFLAADTEARLTDEDGERIASDYQIVFFEPTIQVDLRDDSRSPRQGAFFSLDSQLGGFLTWNYVRLVPDVRVYAPAGPLVIAARFRLGWLKIFSRDTADLDTTSANLGPLPYRLRAGGATSNRGYAATELGHNPPTGADPDQVVYEPGDGGLYRWEASLELRLAINESLGFVGFADMGDLNSGFAWNGDANGRTFRFNYLRLTLGLGLRYNTIIGPLRVDIGWLIPPAQVVAPGESDVIPALSPLFGSDDATFGYGAIHVSIGESF